MSMTDPIADLLTRIRNAQRAGLEKIELPSWLTKPAEPEAPGSRLLRPSRTQDDDDPAHRFAGNGDRDKALRRGSLLHRLIQSLPDIPPAQRAEAAVHYLARAGKDFNAAERNTLAGEVLRLLDDSRFAALFAPGSRAEVSIAGKLAGRRDTFLVAGQIDRLAVTDNEVLIADYKTNRPAPKRIADVPPAYTRQLALYRAVLRKLYPGHTVRAFLVWSETPDSMEVSSDVLDATLAHHLGVTAA